MMSYFSFSAACILRAEKGMNDNAISFSMGKGVRLFLEAKLLCVKGNPQDSTLHTVFTYFILASVTSRVRSQPKDSGN